MSTVIIVAVIAIICVFGIKSYVKKLSYGCCGAGDEPAKKIKVADKNEADYPHCVKVGVEGMTCKNCKIRVENYFNEKDGVWAEVDLKNKSALVRSKEAFSEKEIRDTVSRAGYTATSVVIEK